MYINYSYENYKLMMSVFSGLRRFIDDDIRNMYPKKIARTDKIIASKEVLDGVTDERILLRIP